jgi:lysophospholipase L1-like esterase
MNCFPARLRWIAAWLACVLFVSTAVAATGSQTQHKGIENAAALAPFFAKLNAQKRKTAFEPVRIAHFGDSHVAADILTADIRNRFQAEFGDGGAGYLIPRNPFSTARRGVESGATSGWVINGIGSSAGNDGAYGLAGICLTTEKVNERMWVSASANAFDVYVLMEPGGGAIELTVDGSREGFMVESAHGTKSQDLEPSDQGSGPINLRAAKQSVAVIRWNAPIGGLPNHRLEIKTVKAGRVRILGVASDRIGPGTGVCYDVLGINGARVKRIKDWDSKVLCDTIATRSPDLIILAYGTNEVTDEDWSIESYARLMSGVIKLLKTAAPKASVIVFGPPDRADVQAASDKMPAMLAAQRKAALDSGAAFWCSYDAMGGPGSMESWAGSGLGQPDRVHLSSAGYHRMGEMFYGDLKLAFDDWKKRGATRTRRAGTE